jgi:hypothetical protein
VEKKVEPPPKPGFHSHGQAAPIHHAKPRVSTNTKASADDMLAASLQNLPKGGVHHPHPKNAGLPKAALI